MNIVRPNGKVYRPRKGVEAVTFEDRYGYTGVAVLRTHDIEDARTRFTNLLAEHELWYAEGACDWRRAVPWADDPGHDWSYISDAVRGVPCVVFEPT